MGDYYGERLMVDVFSTHKDVSAISVHLPPLTTIAFSEVWLNAVWPNVGLKLHGVFDVMRFCVFTALLLSQMLRCTLTGTSRKES